MGLAEPRKRLKLSNDPRNLNWSADSDSYGQRLMQSQGWRAGQALGARSQRYDDTDAAKIRIKIKDDTLGLGANLKSKDPAQQKVGFDAFQGLLGRLNAKSDEELAVVEKKIEDRKLATYAQGRWGGMVFVPGGILVQSDPFKQKVEAEKLKAEADEDTERPTDSHSDKTVEAITEKAQRKAEKKQRNEERRLKKEQKRAEKSKGSGHFDKALGLPTPDSSSSNEAEEPSKKQKKSNKRDRSPDLKPTNVVVRKVTNQDALKNGRHILRGRNMAAKRAAFSDMKGLDEIFMRKG